MKGVGESPAKESVATGRTPQEKSAIARRWAWSAWVLACLAYVGDVVFLVITQDVYPQDTGVLLQAAEDFAFVIVATLALVVLRSQPRNQVGWWLMVAGLSFPLEGFFAGLTAYGWSRFGAVGWVEWVGWIPRWIWLLIQINIPFLLLYYPNGKLPSPRWRPVVWSIWVVIAFVFVFAAFDPQPLQEFGDLANPLAMPGVMPLLDAAAPVLFLILPLLPIVGAISLVFRYRASEGAVRQQVKLLGWVAAVSVVFFGFVNLQDLGPVQSAILNICFTVFVAGVITAGIVRYRLFDIDKLVSRTLSYAIVIAVLGAVYAGGFAALTTILPSRSPLAIAASTLAAAALFTPVRRRVQAFVDRRFNRSRYDAERVVEQFAASLRDRTDTDGVADGWMATVVETMHPATAAVWVRER